MIPIFIEPIIQKDTGDCAVTALVMITGKPYPDVVRAAPNRAHKSGMSTKEIIETAAILGVKLVRRRKFHMNEDTGILTLISEDPKRHDHVVLLLEGTIYDGYAGRLWFDPEVFLQTEKYRVGTLLRME